MFIIWLVETFFSPYLTQSFCKKIGWVFLKVSGNIAKNYKFSLVPGVDLVPEFICAQFWFFLNFFRVLGAKYENIPNPCLLYHYRNSVPGLRIGFTERGR